MSNKKDITMAVTLFVIQLVLLISVSIVKSLDMSLGQNPTVLFIVLFLGLPIAYLISCLRAFSKPGNKIIPSFLFLMSTLSFSVLVFMLTWTE